MKVLRSEILILLLTVAMLIPAFAVSFDAAWAAAECPGPFDEFEKEFIEASGFTTLMQATDGNVYKHDGVLNAAHLEEYSCISRLASYSLLNRGECAAEIVLKDVNCSAAEARNGELRAQAEAVEQNGYYSVNFVLSAADNTEMFLTGLCPEYIASVEQEIISSITSGKDFDITNLNFIDAEKQMIDEANDSNLCWAAAAANLLQYTGWTKHLNLRTSDGDIMDCDDILDLFASDFYNRGYNTICGIGYVLNGVDGWSNYSFGRNGETGFGPKPDASRTIHDRNHAYDMVTSTTSFSDAENPTRLMQDQLEKLHNGWGINLNLGWLSSGRDGYYGAHAVTLWGYIVDKDYPETDKNRYTALAVSNSDNSPTGKKDRRTAPNRYTVTWIQPYSGTADSWKEVNGNGVVISMQNLMPYSDSLPVETDERATRNKVTTCDFVVSETTCSDVSEVTSGTGSTFTDSQNIYVAPVISNLSEKDFSGPMKCKAAVCSSKGENACEKILDIKDFSVAKHDFTRTGSCLNLGSFDAGTYTLSIDINSDRSLDEAFYYNNTYTSTFKVITDPARNVELTSTLTGYDEAYGEVELTYDDPDEYLKKKGNTYSLEVSYLQDGSWTSWAAAGTPDKDGRLQNLTGLSEAPSKAAVDKSGEKARFRLVINDGDVSPAVYGEAIALEYSNLQIVTNEINTGTYTPLKYGSCRLEDGEVFACKIRNTSTGDGVLKCRVEIGFNINGRFDVICQQKNIELNKEEESQVISVSRWSKSSALFKSTEAQARVYYESGEREICLKCSLGNLKVEEAPDTMVTIADDTEDMYDGETSLREAVKYSARLGHPDIHISDSLKDSQLILTSPLEINSRISIHGSSECATICAKLSSSDFIFKVGKGGSLNMDHVRLTSKSHHSVSAGIIDNSGGHVQLRSCLITDISGISLTEPLILADGGNVDLQCTTIASVVYGQGLMAVDNGGEMNMLNCMLCDNTGTDAVLCNRNGEINAVYSTFLNNTIYTFTSSSENAACVQSAQGANTNAVGCIILHADSPYAKAKDLSGPLKAMGCFYGTAGEDVIADALCRTGTFADAVETDKASGLPEYISEDTGTCFWQKLAAPLSELEGQLYLKSEDNLLSCSTDGKEWTQTDVKAAFASESYQLDILGKTHNGYPGCYSPTGTTPAKSADKAADQQNGSGLHHDDHSTRNGHSAQPDTGDHTPLKELLILLIMSMSCIALISFKIFSDSK